MNTMTAPGAGFGESAQHDHHGDQAHGDKPNDDATSAPHAQPAPWEPPAGWACGAEVALSLITISE
ncbi:UNVERIFIED_CONTAM: hypothetical protein K7Z72_23600, partial [Mycobacterium avium subsp. hominissuis]